MKKNNWDFSNTKKKAKEKGIDWWERYTTDKNWRVEVEAAAYGKQISFIRRKMGEVRATEALKSFAKYLSSKVYGEVISEAEAFNKIRKIWCAIFTCQFP